MDDKFILMGLGDENSKNVAEVLANKTCRKILDFLADNAEASEKDISEHLEIPINTAEYNLDKLIKAGLIEKSKQFFWSVKGKKIPMYKLAKKHIIISPNKKPNLIALKAILPVMLVIAGILTIILLAQFLPNHSTGEDNQAQLHQFKSYSELKNFLKENSGQTGYGLFGGLRGFTESGSIGAIQSPSVDEAISKEFATSGAESFDSGESGTGAGDFSQTNIQVEGVDEPDIVKNDGKYIYAVSNSRDKVVIIDAYPADNMEILSEIEPFGTSGVYGIRDIFINKDKLIVFSEYQNSQISIYDVHDRENPELEKEISIDGSYVDSRMIGDYVYIISTKYADAYNPEPPIYASGGVETKVAPSEVYYFPYYDSSYIFTSIMAVNIEDGDFNSKVFLTGYSSTIYVSQNNIYLTYQKRMNYENYYTKQIEEAILPLLPISERNEIKEILDSDKDEWEIMQDAGEIVTEYSESLKGNDKAEFDNELMESLSEFEIKIQKEYEKTIIHKINIDKEEIDYVTAGEVSGYLLNQFSMDEYEGYLRVAVTTGNTWRGNSLNHLYILDRDLDVVGSVEDLAKGEKIYSARFMGERAYMVTFKQVDPLFVIDVSNPKHPEVLGYLKVTGYSSYLHPYDENHIIGIGKEATEEGRVSGLKLALFDVTDVKNPVEIGKYTIEGRSTDSTVLYDHKAFLFSKAKGMLVIPVSYTDYDFEYDYTNYKYWQGAYVFNINLDGISLRGKITHKTDDTEEGYWYGPYAIERSLYMDDVLYTISGKMVKANDIDSIEEIDHVDLPYEEQDYPVYYKTGMAGVEPGRDISTNVIWE